MRSCNLQLWLVLEALSPVDTFNQAIIDEKGYYKPSQINEHDEG